MLATRGLEPDLSLPDLVLPGRPEKPQRGQAEFVQTPADYLKESDDRAASPRTAASCSTNTAPRLSAIEQQFGVDPTVLLAILGRETDYGRSKD